MKAIRTILACLRRADQTYNLIQHGDRIIVGLSGGKDSLVLTYALSLYKKFSHTDFVIQPVTLDLGFPGFDPAPLKTFCESLSLELIVSDAREVYPILQKQQGHYKHLPCSICSRMKKAAINKVARELNFNKVAFAHHADDAIETLFMNEIYGAKIGTFSPKMHLERADITFIRPLILTREKDIIALAKEEKLPVMKSICPADKHTTREDIKILLKNIYEEFPTARENFLNMLDNYPQFDLWGDQIAWQINQDGLNLKPVVSAADAEAMIAIRTEVFVKEQAVSQDEEFIPAEEALAHYFLIRLLDKPIGVIRYLEKEDGFWIGRFAILKEYRHHGYGKQAFSYLVSQIEARHNPCLISIHAQLYLKAFYESCGLTSQGEVFDEVNIPHIKMIKKC
ncbi:MAG TPA: GNAT family N-acetyltransferase [Bacilli bacterium]|nr:GNAT family N-acetyltransferase [Bacilli bacterium]